MDNMATTRVHPPTKMRDRFTKLHAWRDQAAGDLSETQSELSELRRYLALSEKVTVALESLSKSLFRELLNVIEEKLTIAVQEVLEQPLQLKSEVQWRRNAATVDFWIERNGNREDIVKGQGGSVTNILSVGLRMFALTTLDEKDHRRFLVLDEQDCWLKPELVPRLAKIVHDAGNALGFQVLMISHHDVSAFSQYADRIYQFTPNSDNEVKVSLVDSRPATVDPV
jgi:ABC-type branched-subunit amino acid transport system ATPase component